MKALRYCLPQAILDPKYREVPGMQRFRHFFSLYGSWVMPYDRTGVMTTPLRTMPQFALPVYRPFKKSYAELCDERASEILQRAERSGVTLYIMYSGGIDSTCMLVSVLKHASPEQKKGIVVLLSHDSIAENPRFFDEHIKRDLRMDSSASFPAILGGKDMFLSAEHNDMILGSDKIGKLMRQFYPGVVHEPYRRETIAAHFAPALGQDKELTSFYMDMFERICDAAPIDIRTNLEFLWWINFSFKWHACYYYILMFTKAAQTAGITEEYLRDRFVSFFNTDEFQLWSMHNTDKRIRDTWKSYKWVAKDIIYEYTKDAEYRDHKIKRGSLIPLIRQLHAYSTLDAGLTFSSGCELADLFAEKNDFV